MSNDHDQLLTVLRQRVHEAIAARGWQSYIHKLKDEEFRAIEAMANAMLDYFQAVDAQSARARAQAERMLAVLDCAFPSPPSSSFYRIAAAHRTAFDDANHTD